MVEEASELVVLLAGGPLGSRPVDVIELPGSGERVLAVPVRPEALRGEWAAARAVLDRTGRWPVASEFVTYTHELGRDPVAIRSAASGLDGTTALDDIWAAQRPWEWLDEKRLAWQLNATRERCGVAPSVEDVLAT
ncbi:MAG: hypothetical protein ACYCXW_24480, partial [Solirubrobacteraceae bacterium]